MKKANAPLSVGVAGGGLAGLSLASAILAKAPETRVVVFEPRASYSDDRTWCFWDVESHQFEGLVSRKWPRWRVATDAGEVTREHPRRAYCRLRAGDLYRAAERTMERAPNAEIRRGARVAECDAERVTLDTGESATFDVVFDGRPPRRTSPPFVQRFVGRRIRTAPSTFDAHTVDLMDFRIPQRRGVTFSYVLPESEREALVEATVFAPQAVADDELEESFSDALALHGLDSRDVDVVGEERGAVPMTPWLPRPDRGAIPIGTRAGAPRGASGYAFLPIQRHSEALARGVVSGKPGPKRMRTRTTQALDAVFLQRMADAPERAPETFRRMFEGTDAATMARFLMERGSVLETAKVMASLPTVPFLGAARRTAAELLRQSDARPR